MINPKSSPCIPVSHNDAIRAIVHVETCQPQLPAAQFSPEASLAAPKPLTIRKSRTSKSRRAALLVILVIIRQRGEGLGDAARVELRGIVDAHLSQLAALHDPAHNQGKRLLDIDLEARTRLHEAAATLAGPIEAHNGRDLSASLQIALVAHNDLDGGYRLGGVGKEIGIGVVGLDASAAGALGVVEAHLGFHVDEVVEVLERLEAFAGCDVVDHEEGVGAEVGGRPHATVLLLAGGVGQGEVVDGAVDIAGDGVVVLDGGVVLGGPLGADEAQRDGGFAAAAVAADGDGDGDGWFGGLLLLVEGTRGGEGLSYVELLGGHGGKKSGSSKAVRVARDW